MNAWYQALQQPPLTPPNEVFGPVWTVLYGMIAVSIVLFLRKVRREWGYGVYGVIGVHILSNVAWTGLFFGLRSPGLALMDILLLDVTLVWMVRVFWKAHRVASILLWPYLAWVLFATYLNAAFWVLNRA